MKQIVGAFPYYTAGLQQIVGHVPYYAAGAGDPASDPGVQAAAAQAAQSVLDAARGGTFNGPPTMMVPASAAHMAPMGRLPYGGSPSVEEQNPRNVRQYPLGFTQLAVAAATAANVTARPQVLFRGYRIVVPASIATNFVLTDLRVGKNSQFVQATELPTSIFQENAFDIALTLDTAQISQDITMSVRNTDGANPHDFRAVIIGAALE